MTRLARFLYALAVVMIAAAAQGGDAPGNDLVAKRDAFIAQHGDLPVGEVSVHGLAKTRASVVFDSVDLAPGAPLSRVDPERLLQQLHAVGLFKRIDIRYAHRGDHAAVIIDLEEKWTLIPIPFVFSSRSVLRYGFFVFDTNLLGYNKKLFVGAMNSRQGWNANAVYIDPMIMGSRFTGTVAGVVGNRIYEDADFDRDVYRRYRADFSSLTGTVGHEFRRIATVSLVGRFQHASVDPSYVDAIDAPSSEQSFATGLRLRYRDQRYHLYTSEGVRAEAEYLHGFSAGSRGAEYDQGKITAEFARFFLTSHLVTLGVKGMRSNLPEVFQERPGGQMGYKTVPSEVVQAHCHYTAYAVYERPIYRPTWGTFTALAFAEGGELRREGGVTEGFYGPGAGVRLYLKSVAIPAFGFDVAYNLRQGNVEFTFAIGMQM